MGWSSMRKKRAWGPSNPLYRYLHRRERGTDSAFKRTARKLRRAGGSVRHRRKSGSRGFASGGLITSAIAGAAAAYFARHSGVNVVSGQLAPAQGAATGAIASKVVGKSMLGGIVGGVLGDMLATGSIGTKASASSGTGGITFYG